MQKLTRVGKEKVAVMSKFIRRGNERRAVMPYCKKKMGRNERLAVMPIVQKGKTIACL